MNRKMLDFAIKHNNYLEGGTKEACVKVREFLGHSRVSEGQISAQYSSVTAEEFVEAVKVLMASAFSKADETPKTWHCDTDCKHISDILCPGECNISKTSPTLCPYFMDEGLV